MLRLVPEIGKRKLKITEGEMTNHRPNTFEVYGAPDLLHFFIPLPDPIKVPDKTKLPFRYPWNPISDKRPCFRLPSEGNVEFAARQIIIFHQNEISMDGAPLTAAMNVMGSALELSGSPTVDLSSPSLPLPVPHTTAEVICVVDSVEKDPVNGALERALGTINDFQTYFHLVTKTPLRRVTKKLLPPVIPVVRMPFATQIPEPTILHVNDGGPALRAASIPTLSQDQLQTLLRHNRAARADIFSAFLLMRQEAMLSYASGNTAAASLFIAIAAETLLTELFLLLSWEEAGDLSRTADVLGERDNISKRLLSELASRLKDDWDRSGAGPLGSWQRQIANLRNDVAHAGKLPNEDEITSAMAALSALEKHVGDQLAKSLRQYPIAADLFLGSGGLRSRHRLKAWQKHAATIEFPVHASELFTRWKGEVKRLRSGPFEGKFENSSTVVVRFGNGAERWYLVDDEQNLACPLESPKLTQPSRSALDKVFANSDFDVTSLELDSLKLVPPVNPEWIPTYLVLPLGSIARWEQCLWVPPPSQVSQSGAGSSRRQLAFPVQDDGRLPFLNAATITPVPYDGGILAASIAGINTPINSAGTRQGIPNPESRFLHPLPCGTTLVLVQQPA